MTCRVEILDAIRSLVERSADQTFTVAEVVTEMHARKTKYADRTIRTHVISKMCSNAPAHHAKQYPDLERVAPGRYRLR